MSHRRLITAVPCLLAIALLTSTTAPSSGAPPAPGRYHNPLAPEIPDDGVVESCADPAVLRGQQPGDRWWYMYCTTDPLNDADTTASGELRFHPIPMMRSRDLVNWTYVGDALPEPPSWASDGAGLWAPDVVYSRTQDRYYLTFVVTDVDDSISGEPECDSDNAIGVATSRHPTGPWRVSPEPVVGPRRGGPDCNFLWTFDPDVLGDAVRDRGVLYYGSYYGGVFGSRIELGARGISTVGTPRQVSIANRYEGANVVRRGDWFYMFASATNCCNGPLTGYSVFAGRSRSRFGPFLDREGHSFLSGRVGGTPVVSMNGNRWVGTGHNSVFRDFDGQWWTVYHAVDRNDPSFTPEPGFTKRPALLDPVDWVDGWPSVRSGRWASDRTLPAPAAQPGQQSRYEPRPLPADRIGRPIWRLSDEFRSTALDRRWSWVREPAPDTYSVRGGELRFPTQEGDLSLETDNASVLTEPAPARDYVVQTKVRLDVPPEGCCYNFVQAGLVVYGGDDAFIKLTHVSIYETRQTEFAKEVRSPAEGYPPYGNTVVGTPGDWTYLRVVVRHGEGGGARYTAYTSQDGRQWVRGGTWTHHLGDGARIGLVSMGVEEGAEAFDADFAYLRVWTARPAPR